MNPLNNKKIILAGGGTGGPVAPLLAIAAELKKQDASYEFLLVGTLNGPEAQMAQAAGINFVGIPAAKFRRYFSWSNFTDIFVAIKSLFVARKLLKKFRPAVVVGAGGYVAVPVSWMARSLRIPVVMHQQDALVGLANRLIWPFATLITTAFEMGATQFGLANSTLPGGNKPMVQWTGNPVRQDFFGPVRDGVAGKLGLNANQPILFIVGGATGADQINGVVAQALPELVRNFQVLHVTGAGKNNSVFAHNNYHAFEFITQEYSDAMKLASIVVCRAGLSTIAELSATGKVAVVVPIPNSHQLDNGKVLADHKAAVVLTGQDFSASTLPKIVLDLLHDQAKQTQLKTNISGIMPHDAASQIATLIAALIKP